VYLFNESVRKRILTFVAGIAMAPLILGCGDDEPVTGGPGHVMGGFAGMHAGSGGDDMGGSGDDVTGGAGSSGTGGNGGTSAGGKGGTGFGGTLAGAGMSGAGMSGAGMSGMDTGGAGMGGMNTGGAGMGGDVGGMDMGGMGGMVDPCVGIGTGPAPMYVDCCPNDGAKTAPGLCGCGYRDANACLQHRYSFNGTSRVVEDVVGTAHGTLVNTTQANGSVALAGGATVQYVDLPDGIVSSLASATFDTWVTWNGTGGAWQRIFDFGNSDQGPGVQGTGQTYLFLTPRAGSGNLRVAYSLSSFSAETLVDAPAPLPSASMQYVAVVVNQAEHSLLLYLNGTSQGSSTFFDPTQSLSMILDENNWLGKSQYTADQELAGTIHEARIYSNARSATDIQASYTAGPDALPGSGMGGMGGMGGAGGRGGAAGGGAGGASAMGGMAGVAGMAGMGGMGTAGMGGMGGGGGPMDACPDDPAKTEPGECGCGFPDADLCLRHRYTFDGAGTLVTDSIGDADGTVVNAVLDGAGSVVLSGGASDQYVSLPAGIISSLVDATVEVWTTWNNSTDTWQRIVDFGSSDAAAGMQGLGQTYLFISPRAGGGTLRAVYSIDSFFTESVVNGTAPLATAVMSHLAMVVDDEAATLSLYLNGALVNTTGPLGGSLADLDDVNNWLGRSQFAPDFEFAGAIHELRIYSSARSSAQLSSSFAAGPDVLPAN
jgi:hypothetical protein